VHFIFVSYGKLKMTKTSASRFFLTKPQMAYYVYQKRVALKNPFSEESAQHIFHVHRVNLSQQQRAGKSPRKSRQPLSDAPGCIKLPSDARGVFLSPPSSGRSDGQPAGKVPYAPRIISDR
jgi:hypothetical protein